MDPRIPIGFGVVAATVAGDDVAATVAGDDVKATVAGDVVAGTVAGDVGASPASSARSANFLSWQQIWTGLGQKASEDSSVSPLRASKMLAPSSTMTPLSHSR